MNLITNDETDPKKIINISANIVEDFSHLTAKEKDNAPKIKFNNTRCKFESVTVGSKVSYSFVFTNEGNTDLILRKVKASCGCTATKPEKKLLKPGESSKISIVFNTAGRNGKQHKTVTVISNDPVNPSIVLHIEGAIKGVSTENK